MQFHNNVRVQRLHQRLILLPPPQRLEARLWEVKEMIGDMPQLRENEWKVRIEQLPDFNFTDADKCQSAVTNTSSALNAFLLIVLIFLLITCHRSTTHTGKRQTMSPS